jgi:hypothetical protein
MYNQLKIIIVVIKGKPSGRVCKEDDRISPLATTRADLPEGIVNYVTQGGMGEL